MSLRRFLPGPAIIAAVLAIAFAAPEPSSFRFVLLGDRTGETVAGIYERVWIKFDGLESLEANVCWVEQSMIGLSYKTPLHQAVFEMILARLA